MARTENYKAMVTEVVARGRHGPYAASNIKGFGWVTFALEPPVWNEDKKPEPGTYVVLSDLTEHRGGWRAGQARFYRPADSKK